MNLQSAARDRIVAQLEYLESSRRPLTIDADTHITAPGSCGAGRNAVYGDAYYHGKPISADELIARLDLADVDMALCWQNPACTRYGDDVDDNYDALLGVNRYIYESALAHPTRIIPAGWTDPAALGVDRAIELAERCVLEFGCAVVKMNPAQNAYPIDSDMVMRIVERLGKLGAAAAFHFGADTRFTPAAGLERVASNFPDVPILGVHMGGGGAAYLESEGLYGAARDLGLRCSNVHFIQSAKRDTHMESDFIAYNAAGPGAAARISCASDAPYGLPEWNFGGFRAMFAGLRSAGHPDARIRSGTVAFDDATVDGHLGENFRKLVVRLYRGLLDA